MSGNIRANRRRFQRWLLVLLASLSAILFVSNPIALAQGPEGGGSPPGAAQGSDMFLTGPTINLDTNANGDVLALGQNVTINSDVNGSLFIVADQALIRGKVHGSVYALATSMNLDGTSELDRSAYLGAVSLITTKGATISRDLYLIAIGAQLRGTVGGTTQAIVGPTEIIRLVISGVDSLHLFSPGTESLSSSPSTALLHAASVQAFDCSGPIASTQATTLLLGINCNTLVAPSSIPAPPDPLQTIGTWTLNRLRDFILMGVIGLILILALPRQLDRWSVPVGAKPILSGGVGLLIAINAILLMLVLAVATAVLGYALNVVGLGALSLLIWGLGFATLGVAFWLFVLLVFYVSQILVAYYGSSSLLRRVAPNTARHRIIPLAIGLLILVVLLSIPVLGPIVGIVSASVGVGAIALSWRDRWSSDRGNETTMSATA